MSARRFLTKAEMLAEIRKTPRQWRTHRKALIETHGFPKPVPGLGQVWDAEAIDAWRRRQAVLPLPAVGTKPDDVDARLEANTRAIVQGTMH